MLCGHKRYALRHELRQTQEYTQQCVQTERDTNKHTERENCTHSGTRLKLTTGTTVNKALSKRPDQCVNLKGHSTGYSKFV